MSTILVTGASGFVGSWTRARRSSTAGHASSRSSATPDGRRARARAAARRLPRPRRGRGPATSPGRATLAPALAGVDAVLHLVAIPRDLRRRRGPPAGQHRGDPRASSPRWPRPASGASSTWARWASRTTRTSTTRARRRRPRRSSRAPGSTGRSSSRRSSSARATGSSTSSPDLVRLSPGRRPGAGRRQEPVPADPRRRRGARRGRGLRRIDLDDRRDLRAGRAALLDVPRDHRRGPRGARQAADRHPDAGPAHRARGRARPSSSTSRSRSPPTSSASSASTTSARSTSSRRGSASRRGTWTGELGYLRTKARDQAARGDVLHGAAPA